MMKMSKCDTCPSKSGCSTQESCMIENNPMNNVGKIIGVMSGKGGVGKSTMSVLIAKNLARKGYKVGILDADITGPSVPRLLNISGKRAESSDKAIIPVETEDGIKVVSLNLLIESEEQPVIWRGPIIAGVVKQFWTDVIWGNLDYLVIDMPPGTGDVALTVMQSIPVSGVVMISVPQDMVSMIVSKAVVMVRKLNIKVLGVIENMSYIVCPDCSRKIRLFEGENTDAFLKEMELDLLGELPMVKEIVDISRNGVKELSRETEEGLSSITEKIVLNLNK
jgi:Mrp family chromosome partitioning ATPase